MPDEYQIHLNFLPVAGELPGFSLYRRLREEQEPRPSPDARSYSLPMNLADEENRASYWVQDIPMDGFEDF